MAKRPTIASLTRSLDYHKKEVARLRSLVVWYETMLDSIRDGMRGYQR